MKRALICGVGGQDGSYLAKLLLSKGYEVYGSSRDAQVSGFANLRTLGIRDEIQCVSIAVTDFRSVLQALVKIHPDEIYNLAGQSSVGLSFDQPVETLESISIATLNLLEAIRFTGKPMRLYNAGSGECFGDAPEVTCNESTPFRPRSPYAVAKAAAFWEVANYREAYELFACTGILFNHESPLRPERFVTRKVIATASRIAQGSTERLLLGNLSISRDWGWAPEYVEAMWRMLQLEKPDDFVIATGASHTLEEFVDFAFSELGLNWRDHVSVDPQLFRPTDLRKNMANPGKALQLLDWQAKYDMRGVIQAMLAAEHVAQ
ncbi:GDP-mannose 4,6-dehydratase [Rhodanobacter sp. OK091]|uniref:GDP-mannose 4,6-dehydratase n=1 Tax=Rhodanobacter sp. OK091 TaxID=1881037 RepID=UPI000911E5B1|nr:GDP-mannose 4,6-dehydratase [Rhodanobacter sp. OK091]SHM29998.1 GDPmannose 4,6-dehydratase [Rhodanobacter sp. OK091]